MKTKLLLLLAMVSFTQGQTLVNYNDGSYITSTVWYDGSKYHYQYEIDSKINNRNISNITIDLCDPCELTNIYGDDFYKIEYKEDAIKFDSISPRGNEFVFGFYSMYAPEMNDSYIKASTKTYKDTVYAPSCQVPEPRYFALASIGFLFLFKRRR